MTEELTVLAERRGALGLITLNRPKALNALNPDMVECISLALSEFAQDDRIQSVVLQGAGDRAFCAGGDVRQIREDALRGAWEGPYQFWFDEYRLNRTIARYTKPIIAMMHGVVMGGGVGLGMHAFYRVGGEGLTFAMPEVGIGFFPDVGGAHILNRLSGGMGRWLALTGARVGREDAYVLGLTTHSVDRADWERVYVFLERGEPVEAALQAVHKDPLQAPLLDHRPVVDRIFASTNTFSDVLSAVKLGASLENAFVAQMAESLIGACPLSLLVTDEHMRRTRGLSLEDVLVQDLRIAMRMVAQPNFAEGIRAQLVDKDRKPQWVPKNIKDITAEEVGAYFEPLARDLTFA